MAKRPRRRQQKTGKGAKRAPVDLTQAPASARAALGRDIRALLRKHGVTSRLAAIHIDSPPARKTARKSPTGAALGVAPAAPPPPAPGPLICPVGQVSRVVCFFRQGTFVCEQRCVPV